MCRNIRVLFNFDPPATDDEVTAASLQYVRKVSGMTKPSKANEEAFTRAVLAVADATYQLLDGLVIHTAPRSREDQAERARERGRQREERLRAQIRAEISLPGEG
ncbi:MAG: DUF2277 domain-containing protein [Myxococcota bacterium]